MLRRGGQKATFVQTKLKASQVLPSAFIDSQLWSILISIHKPRPSIPELQQQLSSSNLAVLFLINQIPRTFFPSFSSAEKWAQTQAEKSMSAFATIFQVSASTVIFIIHHFC